MPDYIEQRDGAYYLSGTRISLDSIVVPFKNGASPESLLRSFPTIGSLAKVYGALTFYLENRDAVEDFLAEQERLSDQIREQQPPLPAGLSERLRRAREETAPRTS